MSSSTSAIFSGNSRFATDFQAVITRAVGIASLPITQLTNEKNALSDQLNALSGLNTGFASLQASLVTLQSSTGVSSYTSSVSDPAIAEATVSTGAAEGSYSLEVTNFGSLTNTMSKDGLTKVADPSTQNLSSSSAFTLTVNTATFHLNPAGQTLSSLVDAINGSGANVHASIVNVGPSSAPDYRLSVQGTKYAADSIQLNDGSADVLDPLSTGANVEYKINGLTTPVKSDTRTVTLAPGLTVDLLAQSDVGKATTVTVSRNTDSARNAFQSFVAAYNSVVDQLDGQRGQSGGALVGNGIISSLSSSLHNLTSYTAPGNIKSLVDLGVTFDSNGKLSVDATTFNKASSSDVLNFLGDGIGSGFLKSATDTLNSVEDSVSGTIQSSITSVQNQMSSDDKAIATNQDRVDQMRDNLNAQMAAADALVASLEQQVSYMSGLFSAMQYNQQTLSK